MPKQKKYRVLDRDQRILLQPAEYRYKRYSNKLSFHLHMKIYLNFVQNCTQVYEG